MLLAIAFLTILHPGIGEAAERQENVCITCHGKLPGKYGEPVKLWQGSIHAENGITCNLCHGGDPGDAANAMNPARGFLGVPKEKDIPAFCGRCHVGVLKDYLVSLHGKALGNGGPTCVTCHGNHQVVKASLALINEKSCSRCHSFERARLIREKMSETENLIDVLAARTRQYKEQGKDTERLEKGLFSLRNRYHSLFHTVDTDKVVAESAGIRTELQKQADQLAAMDEQRHKQKLAGAGAVAAALVAALLFYLLRKSYD
jgi:hypothetical protein